MSPHQHKKPKSKQQKTSYTTIATYKVRIKRQGGHQTTDSNLREVNNMFFQLEVEVQTPQK